VNELAKCADCAILAERITQLEKRVGERFTEADLRYQQRFDAAGAAVQAAFTAQQTATQTALTAAEKAVAAALAAADRAVSKAELAYEKRFESVNEFRATLTDQATKFASKAEVELANANLLDKIDGPLGVARRFDAFMGRNLGMEESHKTNVSTNQWVVGALLGFAALAVAVIALLHK